METTDFYKSLSKPQKVFAWVVFITLWMAAILWWALWAYIFWKVLIE